MNFFKKDINNRKNIYIIFLSWNLESNIYFATDGIFLYIFLSYAKDSLCRK